MATNGSNGNDHHWPEAHELMRSPFTLFTVLVLAGLATSFLNAKLSNVDLSKQAAQYRCDNDPMPYPPAGAKNTVLLSLANSSRDEALRFRNALADYYRKDT